MKSTCSKIVVLILLLTFSMNVFGENIKFKIYFDKNWLVCKPEKAVYYRTGVWDTENKIYVGEFSDCLINNAGICHGNYENGQKNGIFNFYYESGTLKTSGKFKNDQPDSEWTWYYPNNNVQFKMNFTQDDFEIVALNDSSGNSILENSTEFIFSFQNDTTNTMMDIRGSLKNKKKDGNWSIVQNGNTIATDIYRGDRYVKSNTFNVASQVTNKKIINKFLFVPYSIYACEELNLNKNISETEYPFLIYRFPWAPIDLAVGLIGDSVIIQIDNKPMYIGGWEALNKAIAQNVNLPTEAFESKMNWGYVYYQIVIDENGDVIEKKIIKSPDILLNNVLISALNHLERFKPAYYKGHPIKSQISSRVSFAKPSVIN